MGFFKKVKNKVFQKKKTDEVITKIKERKEISTLSKYEKGLEKSRNSFARKIKVLASKHKTIDENYFSDLEETLIIADVSVSYVTSLIKFLKEEVKIKKLNNPTQISELIFEKLFSIYLKKDADKNEKLTFDKNSLNVILVVGVNGSGKTTSVAKLAQYFMDDGYKVAMAAADTFRAGAVEQLSRWAEKINCEITKPKREGQDPASVIYTAIQNAKECKVNLLIADTAGRLQTKVNLMNELSKINNIISKDNEISNKKVFLVLDATTGQNGVNQAVAFNDATKLDGIILTKMDSSSKGGIILSIKESFDIPVKFIGLGEKLEDLEEFDLNKYLYSLMRDFIKVDSDKSSED